MRTEAALIRAIKKNPRDLATLQVYADWLEEKGDPRAEFLRLLVQQEQARLRLCELRSSIDSAWLENVGLPQRTATAESLVRAVTALIYARFSEMTWSSLDWFIWEISAIVKKASEAEKEELAEAARWLHAKAVKYEEDNKDPECYPQEDEHSEVNILRGWMEVFGDEWQGNARRNKSS